MTPDKCNWAGRPKHCYEMMHGCSSTLRLLCCLETAKRWLSDGPAVWIGFTRVVWTGRQFRAVLQSDLSDGRAALNWGKALCLRAELVSNPALMPDDEAPDTQVPAPSKL